MQRAPAQELSRRHEWLDFDRNVQSLGAFTAVYRAHIPPRIDTAARPSDQCRFVNAAMFRPSQCASSALLAVDCNLLLWYKHNELCIPLGTRRARLGKTGPKGPRSSRPQPCCANSPTRLSVPTANPSPLSKRRSLPRAAYLAIVEVDSYP